MKQVVNGALYPPMQLLVVGELLAEKGLQMLPITGQHKPQLHMLGIPT